MRHHKNLLLAKLNPQFRKIHGVEALLTPITLVLLVGTMVLFVSGCGQSNSVTLFTNLPQEVVEPIVEEFKNNHPDMGMKTVYADDMADDFNLYDRIMQEKRAPSADVYWNKGILHTILLKQQDLLESYNSSSATTIPNAYQDIDRQWTGLSGRARVMAINSSNVPESETPASVPMLGNEDYEGKVGLADPQKGIAAEHMATLYTEWGKDMFQLRFNRYRKNGVQFFDSEQELVQKVADGSLAYAVTDSSTALPAIDEYDSLRLAYLNQDEGEEGTVFIPTSVALIKDSPHPSNGKDLIDYLLTPEVEQSLAESTLRLIPIRDEVNASENGVHLNDIQVMNIDYNQVGGQFNPYLDFMRE